MNTASSASQLHLAREKERTLRAAWIISLWAPLGAGAAFLLGRSTTQMADLLRRSSELLALFLAWLTYRKVARGRAEDQDYGHRKLESLSSLFLAAVMLFSFAVVFYNAILRFRAPGLVGWVVPGILVATGGALVNGWFWSRNRRLARLESSPVFEGQWRLYRAKTVMDLAVIVTLGAGMLLRPYPWSVYIDPAGSVFVAVFLLVSSSRIAFAAVRELRAHG